MCAFHTTAGCSTDRDRGCRGRCQLQGIPFRLANAGVQELLSFAFFGSQKTRKMEWTPLFNSLLAAYDATSVHTDERERCADAMVEAVRSMLTPKSKRRASEQLPAASADDVDGYSDVSEVDESEARTSRLHVSPLSDNPVTVDGLTYRTVMNAFQAHKAPAAMRAEFANVGAGKAADLGRRQTIDIAEWDKNKDALMSSLLAKCVEQNPEMQQTLTSLTTEQRHWLLEDLLPDDYWPTVVPQMLLTIADCYISTAPLDEDKTGKADVPSPDAKRKKRKKQAVPAGVA